MRCYNFFLSMFLGLASLANGNKNVNFWCKALNKFSNTVLLGSEAFHGSNFADALKMRGGVEMSIESSWEKAEENGSDDSVEEEYDDYDSSADDSHSSRDEESDVMLMYDEPYSLPPSIQLYVTFGCMVLSNKIDLFSPSIVRLVRYAFLGQVLFQQIFLFYVRLAARRKRDLTLIDVKSPIFDAITTQLQLDKAANTMLKKLSSSLLPSEATIMEYDLKQASTMEGGIILTMCFMWVLHFKLDKVQPLIIQILMGFMNLVYSPLFQIYVLRKNLERPFQPRSASTIIGDSEET